MVNVATPSSARLSTKALAAAGQFRAIALWLNEPLVPQGVYVQVQQDQYPGRLRIVAEFDRLPDPQHLTRYVCHLIWQLNSPLIEGIHLLARPVGQSQAEWEKRVRVMTPALKSRLKTQTTGQQRATMPPAIARRRVAVPQEPLFSGKVKTLRAFMLTGSAVAAFAFGCLAEILLAPRYEPTLPLQQRQTWRTDQAPQESWPEATSPMSPGEVLLTTHEDVQPGTAELLSNGIKIPTDRPNIVNGALEPVRVIAHEQLPDPANPTVTLVFGGDVDLDELPHTPPNAGQSLLAGVAAYQTADVAMVNLGDSLATAATSLEEEFFNRQRPEVAALLKESGVDIVNLTSDEVLAFGGQGLSETLETLDRDGIYRVGAGRNEREARRPEVLDVKGQRIAYLSYDRAKSRPAHKTVGGVNAPDKQAIMDDIQAIRDEVDWLVVSYRWQQDLPEKPSDLQTNLARMAIDQGADLVVGHHPSQLQGAEIYKGRPIVYSLGDFVASPPAADEMSESAVLQVSLRDRQMKVDVIPVNVEAGQPHKANGEKAAKIFAKLQTASAEFETPMAPSIILDARPVSSPLQETEAPQPPVAVPTDAEPLQQSEDAPESPEADSPFFTTPASPEAIAPEGDGLDIEVEAIPKGLLDDWGPKKGSGDLYAPPDDTHLPPEDSQPSPQLAPDISRQPVPPTETVAPEDELAAPILETVDPTEPAVVVEDAISPHSEPLVGPLSAAPAPIAVPEALPAEVLPIPPQTLSNDVATIPPLQPHPKQGKPHTRVFEPLNTLPPGQQPVLPTEAALFSPDADAMEEPLQEDTP